MYIKNLGNRGVEIVAIIENGIRRGSRSLFLRIQET